MVGTLTLGFGVDREPIVAVFSDGDGVCRKGHARAVVLGYSRASLCD